MKECSPGKNGQTLRENSWLAPITIIGNCLKRKRSKIHRTASLEFDKGSLSVVRLMLVVVRF